MDILFPKEIIERGIELFCRQLNAAQFCYMVGLTIGKQLQYGMGFASYDRLTSQIIGV